MPDLLRSDGARVAGLGAIALTLVAVFATYDIDFGRRWQLVMERRLTALATLTVVGVAIALATVLFQTITHNQILTPSIMGFDALYLMLQTALFFVLDAATVAQSSPVLRFGLTLLLMTGLSLALYRWLLVRTQRSLHLLVLVGLVLGIFFRSISSFLQRLMDPTQFLVLQDRFFASFSNVEPSLLAISAVLVTLCSLYVWRQRRLLDVMALGRDTAVGLGVDHRGVLMSTLAVVAVLVSTATALVGPTTFFGLVVAHVAYRTVRTHRHAVTLPAAAAAAVIALVGGQLVLEQLLDLGTSLSVVIELLGGLLFIALLLRRSTTP